MPEVLNLLEDDDSDDLEFDALVHSAVPNLPRVSTSPAPAPAAVAPPLAVFGRQAQQQTIGLASNNSNTKRSSDVAARKQPPPSKKKKTKLKKNEQPHCLIWVCTHGKGHSRSNWRQKDLKIVGVYANKAAAEDARRNVMSQHTCCGHGDILVGGTWEDEIDLVIRPAPLFLDDSDYDD